MEIATQRSLHIKKILAVPDSSTYSGADKSLARPGRKQTTAIEDFQFHISYLAVSVV